LPVTEVVIGGENQVVGTAGILGRIMAIDREVAEAATIDGKVRFPVVGKLHVIDTAAGTGQENEIAIEPVNIEVVTVEALPRPDGGVLEGTGKARQIAELGIDLAHIEIRFVSRPVITGGDAIGDHG